MNTSSGGSSGTPGWNELWSHFHRIVALDQAERKAELAALPPEQAAEIDALLRAHDQDDSLLDRPVVLSNEIQAGIRIGPWRLDSLLGEGGMGQVWSAERADGAYQQRVAIKLLALGLPDAAMMERLARERAILARLDHPNIARLLDGGTLGNGQPYLVMERVDGEALMRFAEDRQLSVRSRLELMRKICAAVDHAHRRLIVHRDLKPANILVTDAGEPKLLDFGIARLLDPDSTDQRTRAFERRLTLEYASPEQLRGDPVDTRSDAFSLGVILHELLVGQRPWAVEGCTAEQAHARVTGQPPRRVSRVAGDAALRRRLKGDLDWIVARALDADPERRYADARELGEDLERALEGFPVQARPPSRSYRVKRFIGRHPWGVGAGFTVLALMLSAGTILWVQSRALTHALAAEQQQTARAASLSEFLAELLVEADPEVHQGDPRSVEQVLADAAGRIEREFEDQPALKAELLTTLAGILYNRGDYARARELTDAALALGGAAPAFPVRMLKLRLALVDGRFDEVLRSSERMLASGDFEQADQLRVIRAEAFQAMDDLASAAHALAGLDPAGRAGDAAIEAWFRQGGLHWGRGDFDAAETSYREALALQIASYGAASTQAARGLNALASVRYRQGDLEEAERLFREVLERHESILGPRHPQTAETRVRLGALLYDRGEHEAAIIALEQALAEQTEAFGAAHPALANTHNNLALALAAQSDFTRAEAQFHAALAINREALGPAHSKVAGNLSNLGWMRIEQGAPREALPLLREALALQRELFPEAHPQLAYTLHHLGRATLMNGELEAAMDWLSEALAIRRAVHSENHPLLADTLVVLGQAEQAVGRPEQALALWHEALEIRRHRFGEDDSRTRQVRALLQESGVTGGAP
ncbi:serine/threonine-protein kinase [Wenzhouxiangella marina]|uniref:Uncharacterized protein n=1 Tax=Wenzhouxiangella marina TaxID=1579979 RepID=A0A0K0XXR5_9GAMM|nr:serine/threonine-protein kinase [Wenzhouxiangella marina]AKS42473.1 hypothetical protein WM2015_2108 [Wenzhouxiangella marina]MBB6085752.1 serine/threonine-protein kinase [Wenzhouxiangella marina]